MTAAARAHRICVVTGTRAEYGLLFWLMKEIDADRSLQLQLIVTGSHLAPAHGNTVHVIEADGFEIAARVDIDLGDDSPLGIARCMGHCIAGVAEALTKLAPDIVVVLGDRFEILAAAEAAMLQTIPIAHIHGGEVTEGAIDDAMRHAITKMAALHFVAAEPYRQRVIQMGEQPDRVFTVGAPGLDHLARTPLLDRAATAEVLGINAEMPFFLITLHPATLGGEAPDTEIDALLSALAAYPDHAMIFTGVNADSGRDIIAQRIESFVAAGTTRARLFPSLGQVRYLSAMRHAALVIGNSSSGIIEAPACGVPTVNIGMRQKGRLRASSIIDCAGTTGEIASAIQRALAPSFCQQDSAMVPPYGKPGASKRIAAVLAACDPKSLHRKTFYEFPNMKAAS